MEFNQECILLQNELRKFAREVILDKAEEFDKTCTFALDNIKKLSELGILGGVIPENFGGAALDTTGLAITLEEISKVCASTALIIATHNALFAYPILKFGSDELKKKYLPRAASGVIIGGFAETATNEITINEAQGNYFLTGKNSLVLNSEANGPFVTILATDKDSQNASAFLFEMNNPGIKRSKKSKTIGMHAAGIGEIIFENYSIQPTNLIGTKDNGFRMFEEIQDLTKICFAAIGLGIAQAATEAAIKYAKERIQFNETIIKFGMVREKIAKMTTQIEAARLLIYEAASKRDCNKDFRREAAMAKYFSSRAAVEITTSAIQIYGGYGYIKDYPVERYFRDAQVINVLCSTPSQEKENIVRHTILD